MITIDAAADVGHVPFHGEFNPAVLRFAHGEPGPFLGSDGRENVFFAAPSTHGASAVVGLSRLGRPAGIDGHGDLCVLYFDVVGPGSAGLAFSRANVRDSSNRILPATFHAALVTAD